MKFCAVWNSCIHFLFSTTALDIKTLAVDMINDRLARLDTMCIQSR
jgi:hypothetical protein